jgi:hypothetical protein
LCFYKNRWFVASQGNQLTTICTASIAGLTETFASSGSDVTQIFQSNVAVPIIFRTSLSDNNAPHQGKKALRAAIMLSTSNFTTANFTVDTENGSQPFPFLSGSSMIFLNNLGNQVNFVNNSNQPVSFFTTGLLYQRTGAAGTGIYLGLSLTGVFTGGSGTGGFTINQAILEYQDNAVMASKMNA